MVKPLEIRQNDLAPTIEVHAHSDGGGVRRYITETEILPPNQREIMRLLEPHGFVGIAFSGGHVVLRHKDWTRTGFEVGRNSEFLPDESSKDMQAGALHRAVLLALDDVLFDGGRELNIRPRMF